MNNNSITVGLDLGDKASHLYVIDNEGRKLYSGRVQTKERDLKATLKAYKGACIAMEAGTHSPWVSRLFADDYEVVVANPRKVRLIYESNKKTDGIDAENLARLARVDKNLLHPIKHRSERVQADLEMLKARDILVKSRTSLINHVRGEVKSFGIKLPTSSTPNFCKKVADILPEILKESLDNVLSIIADLTDKIRNYEKRLKRLAKERYSQAEILRQVSGVGPLTSLGFVMILEDPWRFKSSRSVGAYLGLCPRADQSGERARQCRITKAGNEYLRSLLVNAAQYIMGPFAPESDLRSWGLKRAQRGGPAAKKRAVVGVARRLAVLLHHLWQTGEEYVPVGYSKKVFNK